MRLISSNDISVSSIEVTGESCLIHLSIVTSDTPYSRLRSLTAHPVLYSSTIIDLNSVLYFFIWTHSLCINSIVTT